MPNLFPIRAKFLSAPTSKRLSSLSCLELRKEIQEASRRNLKMNLVWNQFIYEICDRVNKYSNTPKSEKVDKFTPTDISLIFSSFSTLKKNNKQFYNYLLECVNNDSETYSIRDIAILYNSLIRLNASNEFVFDNLNQIILNKLNSKISEKDISLLLNALLELKIKKVKEIFVKCSLILSSRIKYISNLHTLTLLLYSYSRLSYTFDTDGRNQTFSSDYRKEGILDNCEKRLTVNDYEYIILTDVTTSLLSKCTDLLLQMRPTDLLYFYRSFLNLFFNSPESKKNVYSNVVKLYKLHNQILQFKLEFQTRELLILLQLLSSSYQIISSSNLIPNNISQTSDDSGNTGVTELLDNNKYEVTSLEIYRNNMGLLREVKEELVYRIKLSSFVDCFHFMKLLDKEDHSLELVFRRLYDKLNRDNKWESYSNADLFVILEKVAQRAQKYVSDDMKMLVSIIIKKSSKFVKLKELCRILEISELLGVKSNSLSKKLATLECRCDNLEQEQVFVAFHCSVALGYMEIVDKLVPYLLKVTDADHSALLLLDLSTLKFNSLKTVNEDIIEHLKSNIYSTNDINGHNKYRNFLKYFSYFNIDSGLSNRNGIKGTNSKNICSNTTLNDRNAIPGDENKTLGDNNGGLDIDFMRPNYDYVDNSLNVVNYKNLLGEFTEEFGNFISKYDPKSSLKLNAEEAGFLFPAAVEVDSKTVVIVPLFDDFYTTNSKMLKVSKYTQLRLFDYLQIRYICVDLQSYATQLDKSNMLANILQKAYTLLNSGGNQKETTNLKDIIDTVENNLTRNVEKCSKIIDENKNVKRLSNFDRFRMLVSANV